MDDLTFKQFSAINLARCESSQGFRHPINGWSLSDWMLATVGELGEAANIAKKLNRMRDGVPGNKESTAELEAKFRREIGDTAVYLDLVAQSRGFTLVEAIIEVFNAKSIEVGFPVLIPDQPVASGGCTHCGARHPPDGMCV